MSERTYTDAEVEDRLNKELPHWHLEGGFGRPSWQYRWPGTSLTTRMANGLWQ